MLETVRYVSLHILALHIHLFSPILTKLSYKIFDKIYSLNWCSSQFLYLFQKISKHQRNNLSSTKWHLQIFDPTFCLRRFVINFNFLYWLKKILYYLAIIITNIIFYLGSNFDGKIKLHFFPFLTQLNVSIWYDWKRFSLFYVPSLAIPILLASSFSLIYK